MGKKTAVLKEKKAMTRDTAYSLQMVAKDVIRAKNTMHRVAVCQNVPNYYAQRNGSGQGVQVNQEGRASFYGVGSCGAVWCCPVCAKKICEERRLDIQKAMAANREDGGAALLVTFTFSHTRADRLHDLIQGFMGALRKTKSGRAFASLTESVGYIGQIRNLEVNHGTQNGWHPHVHEIWFLNKKITVGEVEMLRRGLFKLWRAACLKSGIGEPNEDHGVDIQFRKENIGDNDDDPIGSYVSKFGFEITYSHTKSGSIGSRNAWAILDSIRKKFNFNDAELFREYSEAMHGKSLNFWSRGLKEHFGINDVSDEDLAENEIPEPIRTTAFTREQWSEVVRRRLHSKVLYIAENDPLFLQSFLDKLVEARKRHNRWKADQVKRIHSDTMVNFRELRLEVGNTSYITRGGDV